MTDQLVLIPTDPSWRMDAPTREAGIRGVARARRALQEARSKARRGPEGSDEAGTDPAADGLVVPAA